MAALPSISTASAPARAIVIFDIDGVIRDVSASYRRAIVATVRHFSGWAPEPSTIDILKGEGRWNNDWEASLELLRRHRAQPGHGESLPSLEEVVEVFSGFYFGGDPSGPPALWRGFIREEPLLVESGFFQALSGAGVAWGFVSGAEQPSARFLLEERLGLRNPPLVAMGDAPEKPDPTGFLALAERLAAERGQTLGPDGPPVAYLGDTVADVETVRRARERRPEQPFVALAVSPPHLHPPERAEQRRAYEERLLAAGADHLLERTAALGEDPLGLLNAPLAPGG
jgi:HAD superfamily phosphatase